MGFLFLLSGAVFAPDVQSIGSPEYAVRRDAHRRLAAAGWAAYPALLNGLRSSVPERADRCETLLDGLPPAGVLIGRLADVAVAGLVVSDDPVPELSPAVWTILEPAVCRAAGVNEPVTVVAPDGTRTCQLSAGTNYREWVRRSPFYDQDWVGDTRVLLAAVRVKARSSHGEK